MSSQNHRNVLVGVSLFTGLCFVAYLGATYGFPEQQPRATKEDLPAASTETKDVSSFALRGQDSSSSKTTTTDASATPSPPPNMNGPYEIQNEKQKGAFQSEWGKRGHKFFDVYSPELATQYASNFWRDMGDNPIPRSIIDQFKGKVIAITGYEHDQVMVYPTGKPGVNPDKDVSVPFNWAYNHLQEWLKCRMVETSLKW